MADLATLADIAAVGGVPVDVTSGSADGIRAGRLLALTSSAVLVFLESCGVEESDVSGENPTWSEHRRTALSAIVAEAAAKRLTVSAAPSTEPFVYGSPPWPQTVRLNKAEKRAIIDLVPITDDADSWFTP